MLASLLIPAAHKARESGRRVKAANSLHQLDLATQAAKESEGPAKPQAAPAGRVRQWFPETLLWRPELITDDGGRASLEVEMADSITTWRVTASAVSADGKTGRSTGRPARVPAVLRRRRPPRVSITRGDEVTVPVVVHNYLDRPQIVELSLADAPWFERQGERVQKLELQGGRGPIGRLSSPRKPGRTSLRS